MFVVTLVGAAVLTIDHGGRSPVGKPRAPARTVQRFAHAYPQDPIVPERSKVRGGSPDVKPADTVSRGAASSFKRFSARLPRGVLHRHGSAWLLSRPAAVSGRGRLSVHGPQTLLIGPRAFLLATDGGTIELTGLRVGGVY